MTASGKSILPVMLSLTLMLLALSASLQILSAVSKVCNTTFPCFGTSGSDTLVGDSQSNDTRGLEGDDTITGKAAGDLIFGGLGTDRIVGDDGNDDLRHGTGTSEPDGSRDIIDCGDGNDRPVINISEDKDIAARNCEVVIAG